LYKFLIAGIIRIVRHAKRKMTFNEIKEQCIKRKCYFGGSLGDAITDLCANDILDVEFKEGCNEGRINMTDEQANGLIISVTI